MTEDDMLVLLERTIRERNRDINRPNDPRLQEMKQEGTLFSVQEIRAAVQSIFGLAPRRGIWSVRVVKPQLWAATYGYIASKEIEISNVPDGEAISIEGETLDNRSDHFRFSLTVGRFGDLFGALSNRSRLARSLLFESGQWFVNVLATLPDSGTLMDRVIDSRFDIDPRSYLVKVSEAELLQILQRGDLGVEPVLNVADRLLSLGDPLGEKIMVGVGLARNASPRRHFGTVGAIRR